MGYRKLIFAWCALPSQVDVVRFLLEAGADSEIPNQDGKLAGEELDQMFEVSFPHHTSY